MEKQDIREIDVKSQVIRNPSTFLRGLSIIILYETRLGSGIAKSPYLDPKMIDSLPSPVKGILGIGVDELNLISPSCSKKVSNVLI